MEVGKRYYYIRISVEYIYSPLYVHFVLFQLVVTHDSFVKGKLNVFRCVAIDRSAGSATVTPLLYQSITSNSLLSHLWKVVNNNLLSSCRIYIA